MFLAFLFLVFNSFLITRNREKNLPERHDQTFTNLTNLFEHRLTTFFSIFLFLLCLFITLDVTVYIFMINNCPKIPV